jgi:hypothetical protein
MPLTWNAPAKYVGSVLAASALALALYAYASSQGLAGTSDSFHYLYAAQSLRQTGQLLMPNGSAYQFWPPLYAVTLSALGSIQDVRWLHGLALLGGLAAWSATGYGLLPAKRAWALPWLLALSSPALATSKFIWSEPLFNLLWAVYFLALLSWLRRGGWGLGLLATGLGCLLPLQRIAGVFLLVGVAIGLLWPATRRLVKPGLGAQLAHLFGAASGLLLWQWHRWPASALGGIVRPASHAVSVPQVMAEYSFVVVRWLLPVSSAWLPNLGWIVLLAVVLWLLRPKLVRPNDAASRPMLAARMLFAGLVCTLLLLTLAAWRERIGHDQYEAERYLSALYPPVLLLVLLAWPTNVRWVARLGPVLLVAWLLYQGVRVGRNAHRLHQLPGDTDYPAFPYVSSRPG